MEVVPGEGARRCDCQTFDHHERLFQNARIPARYRHCTLANYDAGDSESMWIAKREAQIVLDDFLVIEGRGLLPGRARRSRQDAPGRGDFARAD
jgi:hypothetical protein